MNLNTPTLPASPRRAMMRNIGLTAGAAGLIAASGPSVHAAADDASEPEHAKRWVFGGI